MPFSFSYSPDPDVAMISFFSYSPDPDIAMISFFSYSPEPGIAMTSFFRCWKPAVRPSPHVREQSVHSVHSDTTQSCGQGTRHICLVVGLGSGQSVDATSACVSVSTHSSKFGVFLLQMNDFQLLYNQTLLRLFLLLSSTKFL